MIRDHSNWTIDIIPNCAWLLLLELMINVLTGRSKSVNTVNWVTHFRNIVNTVKSNLLTVNKVFNTLLPNSRLPTATLRSIDIEQLFVLDWQHSIQDISLGGLSMMSVRMSFSLSIWRSNLYHYFMMLSCYLVPIDSRLIKKWNTCWQDHTR